LKLYHDSRNPEYRLPLGARKAGETVTLRLRVQDSTPDRVILRLWWANAEKRYEMTASSHGDGFFEYALTLPEEAGLLWYFFIVETNGCAFYYGNAYDQMGGVGAMYASEPPSYQLTVYDPAYETPEWMRDGIMYQIMCDRFYGVNVQQPPQGWLHEDWHEPPSLRVLVATGDNTADDFFGGNIAESMLSQFRFNKAVVFPVAISIENGVETYTAATMGLQKVMLRKADRVLVLADSDKFGAYAPMKSFDLSQEHIYVTDGKIDVETKKAFAENGFVLVTGDGEE
jgi:hypothetical protein